jgi:hypothetical protein
LGIWSWKSRWSTRKSPLLIFRKNCDAGKASLGQPSRAYDSARQLPQTLEAVMLHSLDDLDGKIQAIQSSPEKAPGSKWTAFHRAYGRSFFKGNSQNEENGSEA